MLATDFRKNAEIRLPLVGILPLAKRHYVPPHLAVLVRLREHFTLFFNTPF
jgi:hypothetical protein